MRPGLPKHARGAGAVLVLLTLVCAPGRAAGDAGGMGVLVGTARDLTTDQVVAGARVEVTSPALLGRSEVHADAEGGFRLPNLPPGKYAISIEDQAHERYSREDIDLRAGTTLRVDAALVPLDIEAIRVVAAAVDPPTVDIGSTTVGVSYTSEFLSRVPAAPPSIKGAATRSFEAVAALAPGAREDAYGTSLSGATSPENQYLVDGLSVSHPGFGILATPLSIDFVREMHVVTAGYLPEYGRATGGVIDVVTKSGSNRLFGSVFGNVTPGALEGSRAVVQTQGSTVVTEPTLSVMQDLGFDVGGPIVKDKLWFYAGFDVARTRYNLRRTLHRMVVDASGSPVLRNGGAAVATEALPGTEQTEHAISQNIQAIAKFDWAPNAHDRLTFQVISNPYGSGGNGNYGIDPLTGMPEIGAENTVARPNLSGQKSALAHQFLGSSTSGIVKWSHFQDNQRTVIDTTAGVFLATFGRLAGDGSGPGDSWGAASVPNTIWWLPHPITDFESIPDPALCSNPKTGETLCPVTMYRTGGAEFLDVQSYERYQLKTTATRSVVAAGRHVLKAGFDLSYDRYDHRMAYAGGRDLAEYPDPSVPVFVEGRQYGYLTGQDQPVIQSTVHNRMGGLLVGGFLQDSYSVLDGLTLLGGLRYDAQFMYGADGARSISFPSEWSPRIGAIYDPTRQGRSKIFANYAIYYDSLPLDVMDRIGSSQSQVLSAYSKEACDPRDPNRPCAGEARVAGVGNSPNTYYWPYGAGRPAIDPKLVPPSSGEFVCGGEYELFSKATAGLNYTNRVLQSAVEDMSRDGATSFFVGNPGRGIAKDFPAADRKYDAITAYFVKTFSTQWLAQVSYTLSWLRGNYAGLFRPEDGQLNPSTTTEFDLRELLVNHWGPLPGDRRHQFRVYAARDIEFDRWQDLHVGLAFRGHSGEPTSRLGASAVAGYTDQVFLDPRGSEERLPWVFTTDVRLAYQVRLNASTTLSATIDVFNLFNSQQVVSVDQRYTGTPVLPKVGGGQGYVHPDGSRLAPGEVNPNYGYATAYQPPRTFRFGLKATF